jgi:rhodanese-related sulfurtransferase
LTPRAAGDDNTLVPVPRISKEELKQRFDLGDDPHPVIVDVRLKYPYEHSTITLPGALRLPPDGPAAALSLPRDRDIILYDSDPDEIVGERVASDLIARGFRVAVLKGGITEWANAKFPTDSKSAPQPASAPGAAKG